MQMLNMPAEIEGVIYNGKKLRRETTHGATGTKLYTTWSRLRQRHRSLMCDTFKTFEGYREWALENGYTVRSRMVRTDTKGAFTPSNLSWVLLKKYQ